MLSDMKLHRERQSAYNRRQLRAKPGSGCAPLVILLLVALGVVAGGRHWMALRLNQRSAPGLTVSLRQAFAAFHQGDLSAAVDYAAQLVERGGAGAEAYDLLVRALIFRSYSEVGREADRDEALAVSEAALARWPRDLDMGALNGYALQAGDAAETAGRAALRIVERHADHVLARIVLSLSYGARGLAVAALREAEAGVDLARRQGRYLVESQRALALARGDRGDYRAALAALERALDFNSKLIPLHFEKAHYAWQLGDVDGATVAYFTILALDAGNVKARARLCQLLERQGDRSLALRYCREVSELRPGWSDGWYALGRLHFLSGDYASAQTAFGQCSRLQVQQGLAIAERQLECWYLQGQSAEILGDCPALLGVHAEFQQMAFAGQLPQSWSYPPGGPPVCARATATARMAAP